MLDAVYRAIQRGAVLRFLSEPLHAFQKSRPMVKVTGEPCWRECCMLVRPCNRMQLLGLGLLCDSNGCQCGTQCPWARLIQIHAGKLLMPITCVCSFILGLSAWPGAYDVQAHMAVLFINIFSRL